MDAEEERDLAQAIERGDESAKRKLVEEHLWLINWIARRYHGLGLPFEDLQQEGVIALFQAIKNFDYRKGRFSTHASFWIRQQMTRAIFAESSLIKLPIPVHEEIRTGKRELNSVPTVDFSLDEKRMTDKKARPNCEAIKNIAQEQLMKFLQDCLSKKEFFDTWHYFKEDWTMLEIAKARGVSRQTVHGNIQEALRKLRHFSREKILKELLEDS
ncbi:MAG: hypothetical protein COX44_01700 [Candidatus Portnoybacteria bacterium CG23_combo_of_CG06-09_8_20_14_all_37_13]|uniref:RNA polymerase sigma-70 region 2 domain-containing protein n=1 Tax=Candidatus Portnoybacteria bacterium CG23_combo_of_CG06-09_8_20_14_all_37_13 TaxID=1974819 RepID=A0A2G9YD45_9BACT|nr:MAG: hypothetical protein COX44_01700 [Candidatus Portnoybacteria bacterium CG23_combo_of_CG06-09_8_20_14_all_37_13]